MLYVNEMLSQMLFCFVFNRDNEGINGKMRNTSDISQTSFHFPGGQIEQASEQTSAPRMSKKWEKWGGDKQKLEKRDPLFLIFSHPLTLSFPLRAFGNERLLRRPTSRDCH